MMREFAKIPSDELKEEAVRLVRLVWLPAHLHVLQIRIDNKQYRTKALAAAV